MTSVLAVAVLVAGGGLFWTMRSRGKGFTLPLAAGILLVAALLSAMRIRDSYKSEGYGFNRQVSIGVGGALGAAIALRHPDGGEVLVIQPPDLTMGMSGIPERQWSGLERALGRKFTLVRPDIDSAVLAGWHQSMQPELTPALARSLTERHSKACAVVSFMGLPGSRPEDAWPAGGPQLFAFGQASDRNRLDWIRSDRLGALVIPKRPAPDAVHANSSPADLFDALYERIK